SNTGSERYGAESNGPAARKGNALSQSTTGRAALKFQQQQLLHFISFFNFFSSNFLFYPPILDKRN
ncbi:hypothetical protein CFP56_025584, partial [Quercus suber]